MPPKAGKPEKNKTSGSAVQNKKSVTASEKSGAADLPNGEKREKRVPAGKQNAANSRKKAGGTALKESDESAVSCKTPQVMRLISDDSFTNPVIAAGKSRIPTRLRGREPLSSALKRQLHGEPLEQGEAEVVNLTEIAVKYEAPLILDRFNACSCEKCVKIFSEMVLTKVPARFARITKSSPEARARELNNRVEPVRKTVQVAMIRELIGCKKRLFHNE